MDPRQAGIEIQGAYQIAGGLFVSFRLHQCHAQVIDRFHILRIVSEGIRQIRSGRPGMAGLVITHYMRILEYLVPDRVHVLVAGRIVESGGPELAAKLDAEGFEPFRETAPTGGPT